VEFHIWGNAAKKGICIPHIGSKNLDAIALQNTRISIVMK
jgi:hypothetical protein